MEKIYVLDTNVPLSDPMAIFSFGDNEVVIPSVCIEELDSKKKLMDELGRNARHVSRELDKLRERGRLHEGVNLDNGGKLKVVPVDITKLLNKVFLSDSNDNAIISVAYSLMNENPDKTVVMVSRDTNVRIQADAIGVLAEDYQHDKVVTSEDELYKGYVELETPDEIINAFYRNGRVVSPVELIENQYVLLKSYSNQSAIARYNSGFLNKLYQYDENEFVFGLQAKNVLQKMTIDLLLDPNIPLVTISGKAGTGKTLLALAAALQQTIEPNSSLYGKIAVARPIVPLGKDIGYLPGEKEEKLRPWMQPIYDNLEFLFNCKDANELDNRLMGYEGIIQVEALTYIRGRSIPNQIIIIDEAQNLTQHEAKTILTRVGENSKIILTGDPYQIDNPYLDVYSNGLTYVTETMKYQKETGHITLRKGERSTLAQLCADML